MRCTLHGPNFLGIEKRWQVSSANPFCDAHFNAFHIISFPDLLKALGCTHTQTHTHKISRFKCEKEEKSRPNRSAILTWDYGNLPNVTFVYGAFEYFIRFHFQRKKTNAIKSIRWLSSISLRWYEYFHLVTVAGQWFGVVDNDLSNRPFCYKLPLKWSWNIFCRRPKHLFCTREQNASSTGVEYTRCGQSFSFRSISVETKSFYPYFHVYVNAVT